MNDVTGANSNVHLVDRAPSAPAIEGLHLAIEGALVRLTMVRPNRGNALSLRQLDDLITAARWIDARSGVKVVVVDGEGEHFSSGADMADWGEGERPDDAAVRFDLGRAMIEAIANLRPITLARLHGRVRGGGAVLAMACDLRFAIEGTEFAFPEARLGWPLPWGGVPRLVREVGPMVAKDLVLNCRPLSAAGMVAAGLALVAGSESDVDAYIDDTVGNLLATASIVLETLKSYIDGCADAMVPVALASGDTARMLAALADDEAVGTTRAALAAAAAKAKPNLGPRPLPT